ncbi:MAG: endolytic transglycosylase MltG [Patescibacteria group bacterium]
MLAAAIIIAAAWLMLRGGDRAGYVFVPNDVAVTIPEGTNLADIDRLISEAKIASSSIFLTPAFLAREGTFFPDTYRFDRGSTAQEIYARFEENFAAKCDASCKKAITLASILEKEVQTLGDMRIVAGIIEKRLAVGMPLQLDATVAYGVCYAKFIKNIYCDVSQVNIVDNIRKDSAYNTYTRTGLPVGPISNPGLKAIDAAQHPVSSDYWYYLSAKDGTTIFSRTLAEHNRARAKYLN